jgi:hypothetical protein
MINKRFLSTMAVAAMTMLIAAPALAQNPYARADESWISISGTVGTVSPDTFTLDYGDGIVIVEMDDWDYDADAYKVMQGDKVVVTGMVDDDFFESTSIEASSVYVEDLNTYFYASPADEEDHWASVTVPITISETTVIGTVTEVGEHEFTVDTALRELTVDTTEMLYNPLDDEGYQKVRVGDRVRVSGEIDVSFFEGRELMAESIVTLSAASS